MLSSMDSLGLMPAQLAFDEGLWNLGLYMLEQQQHLRREKFCGRGTFLEKVVDLHLTPVIWALIMGLLFVFINKVKQQKNTKMAQRGGHAPIIDKETSCFKQTNKQARATNKRVLAFPEDNMLVSCCANKAERGLLRLYHGAAGHQAS